MTALNYFGETAASSIATTTTAAGQVLDVVITPVAGAQQYNVYFGGNSTSNLYLQAGTSVQSGVTYTGVADRELGGRCPVHDPGRAFRGGEPGPAVHGHGDG